MNKYLIGYACSESFDDVYIIEASNVKEAFRLAAKKLFKLDELFIEHLKECTVNMSFAEKFWLQKENEQNYFCEHHEVLIDFNEFKKRVKSYFGLHVHAAQDYITFYTLKCDGHEKESFIAFEKFIKNAEDFLVNEYLDYAEFEAIDISKITKL